MGLLTHPTFVVAEFRHIVEKVDIWGIQTEPFSMDDNLLAIGRSTLCSCLTEWQIAMGWQDYISCLMAQPRIKVWLSRMDV